MPFKTNFKSETLEDGKVIVYDVPIFAVCEKQGIQFNEDWIDRAVSYHQNGEANGGAWAMHIHHTGEEGRTVLPAGAFTNTRKGMVRTKDGEMVAGVVCDLVFSDEEAAKRAKLGQLLWRSPEIPLSAAVGEKPARFKSLALLDRDAPHNDDLPILTFKRGASVPFRKKVGRLVARASVGADPVLAFAETTDSIFALMEPTTMPTAIKKTTLKLADEDNPFEKKDDGGGESEGGEGGGEKSEKGGGWKSKLDALKACKIEAEDIPDFVAALQECAAEIGGESAGGEAEEVIAEEPIEDEPELDENVDGPADPLEDLPMKDESEVVVKLRDELVALKADRLAEKKLTQQRELERGVVAATDEAFDRLKTKGFSRDEVIAFGADEPLARRAATIKKLADVADAKLLDRAADFEEHVDFHASGRQDVPDEVMKFSAEGPEVYEDALAQHRLWLNQDEARRERIPLKRWLEINRPGKGNPNFATGG